MSSFQPSVFLRRVLLIDAATCAAAGLLMSAGAAWLAAPLGLPRDLLLYAGLVLFPVAAFLTLLAMRAVVSRAWVWTVIALNAGWAIASIGLLVGGWVAPTLYGHVFVAAQAIAVAVLTELEYFGLRKRAAVA